MTATTKLDDRLESFLRDEAALLNQGRYHDWLELLTEDFDYRMPQPCVRDDPRQSQFDEEALLAWESWNSLRLRFERLASDFAWADRPPPLERRHLTAVRHVASEAVTDGVEHTVDCDVLVARSRRPDGTHLVSAGRVDTVLEHEDRLLLRRRRVYVDLDMPSVTQISMLF